MGSGSGASLNQEVLIAASESAFASELSGLFVDALHVDRAAVSTMGPPFDVETISASDGVAARIMEFQLDAGEGPAWDAYRGRSPIVVPSVGDDSGPRWPMFAHAISGLPVCGVHSFPLTIGALSVGVVDLYTDRVRVLSPAELEATGTLAAAAAKTVFEDAIRRYEERDGGDGAFSRREVHQATGMLISQLRIPPSEALLRIRAHAFLSGRSVREVSADITARRVTIDP